MFSGSEFKVAFAPPTAGFYRTAPGRTSSAPVHEAYLRLVGEHQFDGQGHFLAAASGGAAAKAAPITVIRAKPSGPYHGESNGNIRYAL